MTEISIYGDLASEKYFESDITAAEIAERLTNSIGKVIIHLNSNGGEVFTDLTIANLIKQRGDVEVIIEGVCASAATLIACGAARVKMARNALYMTHLPSVYLSGYQTGEDLDAVQKSLTAVKNSILQTYADKLGVSTEEIAEMLDTETWYTAEEAKAAGFIDEIIESAMINFDDVNKNVIVNSKVMKTQEYFKLKSNFQMKGGKVEMETTILDKIKNLLNSKAESDLQEVRNAEMERIKALNKLRTGNKAVDRMVDVAISAGDAAEVVEKYITAIGSESESDKTLAAISALIEDNLTSGGQNVVNEVPMTAEETRKQQAELIAKYANGRV